jgi:hypothetical protein
VRGDGSSENGSDGVVHWTSAHIDGVEFEKIARSGYSLQMKQEAIQELRWTLLDHASAGDAR